MIEDCVIKRFTAQEVSGSLGPQKRGAREKTSQSIFEHACLCLEQTVVAVGTYNILGLS